MTLQISNQMTVLSAFMQNDFETIKQKIYDHNITNSNKISFKLKDNMMLIYNDFVLTPSKSDLFNHSRSVVLTAVDGKYNIVSYTHPVIDYNNQKKLDEFKDKKFVECYEGTLISIYYCNDKWNYSTRKCLDSKDSHWIYNGKTCDKSHYDMFVECVGRSIDEFESNLDKTKSYYYVVVHHENKIFVDYTSRFGEGYKKIFLLFVRDENMNICSNYSEIIGDSLTYTLDEMKSNLQTEQNVLGYLINDDVGGNMFVYHTKFYESKEKKAPYAASYESMLMELYKRDNLNDHLVSFPENVKYKGGAFDTKGVMYGVMTYLSFSLLNLYYHLTNFDGTKLVHKNPESFKVLFEEKNQTLQSMLYKMKGAVLANKRKLEIDDVKKMLKYYITTNDLIRSLKELEEVKKGSMEIFMKMNPKYKENAIVAEFIKNL